MRICYPSRSHTKDVNSGQQVSISLKKWIQKVMNCYILHGSYLESKREMHQNENKQA